MPLANHDRLIVVIPPFAEMESGFTLWLRKMGRLAGELATPTLYYCNRGSQRAIIEATRSYSIYTDHTFYDLEHWDSFLNNPPRTNPGDLMVFIAAREGSVSYSRAMENLPSRTENHFGKISKVAIYPS
jgi:hypothetical protein